MRNEMTLARLREIVEVYGASPARWPQAEKSAAEALASSPEAQTLLAEAARLDALLDMAPAEAPSAALAERLMAARPRAVAPRIPARRKTEKGFFRGLLETVWPYGSAAFPAGALAAALVMGVALGSASDISLTVTGSTVTASAETETGEGLIALAMADQVWPEEWTQ